MAEKNKLAEVSMVGRLAYTIMCVESFLKEKYPEKDWKFIAKIMWEGTLSENWEEWTDKYCVLIPEVLNDYSNYDEEDMKETFDESEYKKILELFSGITEGREDDPTDEVNFMLNKPFEMGMVYEGTHIGDGHESFEIIEAAEKILLKNNIPLPDYTKVLFSSIDEFYGWGNKFDGTHLSIILN